jgi:hypothetical protein
MVCFGLAAAIMAQGLFGFGDDPDTGCFIGARGYLLRATKHPVSSPRRQIQTSAKPLHHRHPKPGQLAIGIGVRDEICKYG